MCDCHAPERQPHEVLIFPWGKSRSWQLQYLEMLFKKEQWFRNSDSKSFLLEKHLCSESDLSFPSPKKGKNWRSSKPVSVASSSNTGSHSDRSSSAKQTTEFKNSQCGLSEMPPKMLALFKSRLFNLGLPRLQWCSLNVASSRSQVAIDLPFDFSWQCLRDLSSLLISLCYFPVTLLWYLNIIVPNSVSATVWLSLR